MQTKKFGILLIFSIIPFVGLNSLTTVFADHGGLIGECPTDQLWDPNSGQCVPDDQCPNGVYPPLSILNAAVRHCASIQMMAVGGEMIPLDTTMILVAGTQTAAAWMIPVIVSGIGIAIVIARKF